MSPEVKEKQKWQLYGLKLQLPKQKQNKQKKLGKKDRFEQGNTTDKDTAITK